MKLSRISAHYDAAPNSRADSDRRAVNIEHALEVHTTTKDSKRTVCARKRLHYLWYSTINHVVRFTGMTSAAAALCRPP
jgi:hypothetical protein